MKSMIRLTISISLCCIFTFGASSQQAGNQIETRSKAISSQERLPGQQASADRPSPRLEVYFVSRLGQSMSVAVSVHNSNLDEFSLTVRSASIRLKDDREFPVTSFIFRVQPSLPYVNSFATGAFMADARPDMKVIRKTNNPSFPDLPNGAEVTFTGLNATAAPLFKGTGFRGDELYLEMVFDVPDVEENAAVSVRVGTFPPLSVPQSALRTLVFPGTAITVENRSGDDIHVRVVGPTLNEFIIGRGKRQKMYAQPGSYYLKIRSGLISPTYFRGEPFELRQGNSGVTISIEKMTDGLAGMTHISSEVFEKP